MNTFSSRFLATCACCIAFSTANAAPQQIEYLGVDPLTDVRSAALVIFEAPVDNKAIRKCTFESIGNDDTGKSKNINYKSAVFALIPGQYFVKAIFSDAGKTVFVFREYRFETGRRYRATCEGTRLRQVKIVITDIGN